MTQASKGWRAICALACLVALPAHARAQARCVETSGRQALRALDDEVSGLAADSDPRRARELLARVLAHPCFARASEVSSPPSFDTAISARAWWEAGGKSWLSHYLTGSPPSARRAVVFPPDELPVLSVETAPRGYRPRSLLCSMGDASCGRETAGWALRAEAAFAAHRLAQDVQAAEQGQRAGGGSRDDAVGRDALLARCARDMRAGPADDRYVRWHACVAAGLPRPAVLPLGRVRAPSRGWLVLRGRRGHYRFCDEVRAYDLATGAAWIASSCGGLALRDDGSVDFDATDRARNGSVVTGVLPVDALREAAWMILIVEQVTRARRWAEHIPPPPGLEPRAPSGGTTHILDFEDMWFSSAQTTLAWSWVDGGRVLAEGTLRWPDSYRAAENHAASLVRVVEAALAPGCPPAQLPPRIDAGGSRSGVSLIDADPATRGRVEDRLADRLRDHALPGGCRPHR